MSERTNPDLRELADAISGAMPPLPPEEQRFALALYRQLARGEPVPIDSLAVDVDGKPPDVDATLERWPGVYRDGAGRVVAFWGLAIPEMPHRFRVDGRRLYTWCAWDALFIPELIGRTAEVESQSPVSGDSVRLTVTPEQVLQVAPEGTVVSMLVPAERFDEQVIMSFCHFVHFFPSVADAEPWLGEHSETFLLSVDEAFELGRLTNRSRFGAVLAAPAEPRPPQLARRATTSM